MEEEPQKELKNSIIINKNKIKFDMLKIFSLIKKNGSYKEGKNIFELYKGYQPPNPDEEEQEEVPKYLVDIKSDNCRYLGILSNYLKKEIFGYSLFDNGDEYFGQWIKDRKEGFGIYYFKENEKEETNIKHIYIGEFKNNKKYGQGIYFKIKKFEDKKENKNGKELENEKENEKELEKENEKNMEKKIEKENLNKPCDFTFSIGNFCEDNFKEGIIYNLEGEKRQIYKGKMNENGEKMDENAEIYENKKQIFNGSIKDNIMLNGRIIVLKEEENKIKKEEAYYFQRKDDKIPSDEIDFDYRKGEEKDEELIKKMKELFEIYDCEKLKELYLKALEFREKITSQESFQYIKNLDYDIMVKEELKKIYLKYFYME